MQSGSGAETQERGCNRPRAGWSAARGCGGAVALQAASLRAAAFYERLGFRRMRSGDDPLSLVPPGEDGWSPEILRVVAGRPESKEREMPWLLLEPARAGLGDAEHRGQLAGPEPALHRVGGGALAAQGRPRFPAVG